MKKTKSWTAKLGKILNYVRTMDKEIVLMRFLSAVLAGLLAGAILADPSYVNKFNFFDISMVSATLGGFLFLSGSKHTVKQDSGKQEAKEKKPETQEIVELKQKIIESEQKLTKALNDTIYTISRQFLTAAVCFSILGFTEPLFRHIMLIRKVG